MKVYKMLVQEKTEKTEVFNKIENNKLKITNLIK